MPTFSEHRLIRKTVEELNALRRKAGVSELTQTGSDTRTLDSRVLPGETTPQGDKLNAERTAPPVPQAPTRLPFGNRVTPEGKYANDVALSALEGGASMKDAQEIGRLNAQNAPVPPPPPTPTAPPPPAGGLMIGGVLADPVTAAQHEAAIAAKKTEELKQQQLLADADKKARDATTSATPTIPGQEAGGDTSLQGAALDAVIGSLPPEYAFLGPALKNQLAQSNTAIGAQGDLYGSSVAAADASYNQGMGVLGKLEQSITQTKDDMKGILDAVKKSQEEQLVKQQKAADDNLVWYQQKEERRLRGLQKAEIEGAINELGFKGGFGSGNGIKAINEAEAVWEQKITDLGIEVGLARTDLAVKFSGLYNDVQTKYVTDVANNLKDYKKEISTIALTGLGLEDKKAERRQNALSTLVTNVGTLQTGLAKELTSQAKEIAGLINQERARKVSEENQKKQNAYQFFNFAFTQSTDPKLRQGAVDAMNAAGYTLPEGMDMNADPVSFQLAMMNNQLKADQNSSSDPFRFKGEGSEDKQALSASALTVVGQLEGGVELNRSQLNYVNNLLDRGETEKAKTHLRGLAVAALKGPQENAYAARSTIRSASASLLKELRAIQDTSTGQQLFNGLQEAGKTLAGKDPGSLTSDDFTAYNKAVLNLKKKLGTEGNPALQTIFAQVENIAGLVINERYGAAVTDGELARAQQYIAMSGNTLSDMIIKLEQFSNFSKLQNEVMLNTKMGLPSSDIDLGAPDVNSSPVIPADEDFNNMFMTQEETPTIIKKTIGEREVTGATDALSALEKANQEFFATYGHHLIVNSSYRSTEQQQMAWERFQSGEIARAAPPGKSLHEKGIAFDITNWKEAKPFLIKYGFLPLPKNIRSSDPAHFSYKIVG